MIALAACSSTGDSHSQPEERREFVVFMEPNATAAETTAVRRYLAKSPRVDRVTFVSKEAA